MKNYKTIKIENAKSTFFESKEQYLQFRQNWKQFIKDGRHLKKCPGTTTARIIDPATHRYTYKSVELRHESELTFIHHLIYCLLCGKQFNLLICDNPLKPATRFKTYSHIARTKALLHHAQQVLNKGLSLDNLQQYQQNNLGKLLAPFGDSISILQLVELFKNIDSDIINWNDL